MLTAAAIFFLAFMSIKIATTLTTKERGAVSRSDPNYILNNTVLEEETDYFDDSMLVAARDGPIQRRLLLEE